MKRLAHRNSRRRASVAVLTAFSGTVLIGFASLSVDVGMLYNVRTELQRTADAAAMAGAWKMLDQKARGMSDSVAKDAARTEAKTIGGMNHVYRSSPLVDENTSNSSDGDVIIGYLNDPTNLSEPVDVSDANKFNSVTVRVNRNDVRNGPVDLFFARIFGINSTGLQAQATATYKDGVVGWKVTDQTGNAGLLPLALHVDAWNGLLAGTWTTGDNYTFDPDTGTVSPGSDGWNELNLYPGAGPTQLPPGNFGTVDIGSSNNSTADISRQIQYGVSESDLAYFGGELKFGDDGTLSLNGDTGLSAAIKDDLTGIKGVPRSIPIFDQVAGPGNNSMFRVIGFVGIRIMNVDLNGSMNSKNVIIEPAVVVDDAVITEAGEGPSYLIYSPVHLTR